jgi:beta-galactosidase
MHYWRLDPDNWARALDSIVTVGFRFVDTYVPWAVHETAPRIYDFGAQDPRRNLRRFLQFAHERDLCVLLRPGPHINAELTYFGLPERVVWNSEFQARTARGNPVILPMLPLAFPVPSYASSGFLAEVEHWFAAVGEVVTSMRAPDGPIALVQVDNEAAFYFRDGPYDQDYHPDAIFLFRDFLRKKYSKLIDFRAAWEDRSIGFQDAEPPREFDAKTASQATRHLDWMEFQEHLLGGALERMTHALAQSGLGGVPTVHNFPPGEAATPLNASRLKSIDLVGLDYYHRASPNEHLAVFRRTTELASRCEGQRLPAFAVEMGAGSPPFLGPFDEDDSIYVWLSALAYGLVGYNAYMAVDRDRWVGAPIDPRGNIRPFGERVRKIHEALDRLSFHTLRRHTPVKLVVPRSMRRLARAMHAFGALSPALFNVLGGGFAESCFEDHLDLGKSVVLEAERFLRVFEQALFARGVPFGYAGGESLADASVNARWLVVPTAGGLKPDFWAQLRAIRASGCEVTIGPTVLDRDGGLRPLKKKLDVGDFELASLEDPNEVAAIVARHIEALKLPAYTATHGAYVTLHHDKKAPKAVVLMNPRPEAIVSSVSVMKVDQLRDALTGRTLKRSFGAFEVSLPPRSVRLFAVEKASRT